MNKNSFSKNYGIDILKSFACFVVILCHLYLNNPTNTGIRGWLVYYRPFAVPIFMIISGYYTYKLLINGKKNNNIKKGIRLFLPLFGWAIIYFVVYKITGFSCEYEGVNHQNNLGVSDLLYQIFMGHSRKLNPTMWYSSVLLILNLSSITLYKHLKSKMNYILMFFSALSIFLQYSGLNVKIFENLIFELKYPLGRLIEMIPYFSTGLMLAQYNVFENLKKYWKKVSIICLIFLIFNRYYNIFVFIPGFDYSGVSGLFVAFFTILLFYVIPFEKLPNKLLLCINFLSKYTLGIYCMHKIVSKLVNYIFNIKDLYNFKYCIIIYIICFLVSFLISLIPNKYVKQLVN